MAIATYTIDIVADETLIDAFDELDESTKTAILSELIDGFRKAVMAEFAKKADSKQGITGSKAN